MSLNNKNILKLFKRKNKVSNSAVSSLVPFNQEHQNKETRKVITKIFLEQKRVRFSFICT